MMRKLIFLFLIACFSFISCDDGDVITLDLTFDQELDMCGNGVNYVVYDTKTDPYESLTLLFPVNDTNNLIFSPVNNPHTGSMSISNSVKFNYRIYNGNPLGLICQEIPSSEVTITKDYAAENGIIYYTSTYEDVDNIRTVTVTFTIEDLDLDILNSTEETLGTYVWSFPL